MSEADWRDPEDRDPGPRKTFWEHVEDLRKVLVKSAIAIGVALVVCLLLDKHLVRILEWPLRNMDMYFQPKPTLTLQLGATRFGPFEVSAEDFPGLKTEVGASTTLRAKAVKVGEQTVLALEPVPEAEAGEAPSKVRLHNIGPAEGFFIAFRIGIYGAIILSSPFWIYFMGQFLLPALHVHEKRILYAWLGWGTFLFACGVLLTYFVLLPLALQASMKYSEMLGFDASAWRADDYINFVTKFVLGMGVGFQFPVVILILVKLGFINYRHLMKYRRHVLLLCFIMGAILTTPEVVTQVAMAVPLYLLYEASIIIAWYWDRQKRKAEAGASG